MADLRAQTTGRLFPALLALIVVGAALPTWADPPVPGNQTATYTGTPSAAAATFRTTVQEYLSCNILDPSIELAWNPSRSWWEGTTTVEVEANRAYEFRTGWRQWVLSGYSGAASSNLDGFHGNGTTDQLPASDRKLSGHVDVLVQSSYSGDPGPSVNSYPGQPQDQLNVTFNGGQPVGVVQVTLFAW